MTFFVINWQVFAVFLNNSLHRIVSEFPFSKQNQTKTKPEVWELRKLTDIAS